MNMFNLKAQRVAEGKRAFTLIELIVVIVIIGILAAVASIAGANESAAASKVKTAEVGSTYTVVSKDQAKSSAVAERLNWRVSSSSKGTCAVYKTKKGVVKVKFKTKGNCKVVWADPKTSEKGTHSFRVNPRYCPNAKPIEQDGVELKVPVVQVLPCDVDGPVTKSTMETSEFALTGYPAINIPTTRELSANAGDYVIIADDVPGFSNGFVGRVLAVEESFVVLEFVDPFTVYGSISS